MSLQKIWIRLENLIQNKVALLTMFISMTMYADLKSSVLHFFVIFLPKNKFDLRQIHLEHAWMGLFAIFALICVYKLYCFIFSPFNIEKLAEDVGYNHLKSKTGGTKGSLQNINDLIKRRRIGDIPPVYPNGWFLLEESRHLKRSQVKEVQCLGEHFAVYRGEDGEVRILEAYCPHLGTNLAVGGLVIGNCLQCPFHGWEFNGQGVCEKIPGLEKVPNGVKTKAWESCNVNGLIFVWYHCEKEMPDWTPPSVVDNKSKWIYCGRTEHHVNCHIQDIPENAGDVAHLNHLHIPPFMSGSDLRYTFSRWWTKVFQHSWDAKWSPDEAPNKHMSTMLISHKMLMFGKEIFFMTADVLIKQIGPGLVHLTLKNKIFGHCVIIMCVTPEEPMKQKVIHTYYADSWWCKIFARITCVTELLNFERDVMIWNHKKYISHPVYSSTDKLIKGHRNWFKQFYTDNSPRFNFQFENLDW